MIRDFIHESRGRTIEHTRDLPSMIWTFIQNVCLYAVVVSCSLASLYIHPKHRAHTFCHRLLSVYLTWKAAEDDLPLEISTTRCIALLI